MPTHPKANFRIPTGLLDAVNAVHALGITGGVNRALTHDEQRGATQTAAVIAALTYYVDANAHVLETRAGKAMLRDGAVSAALRATVAAEPEPDPDSVHAIRYERSQDVSAEGTRRWLWTWACNDPDCTLRPRDKLLRRKRDARADAYGRHARHDIRTRDAVPLRVT